MRRPENEEPEMEKKQSEELAGTAMNFKFKPGGDILLERMRKFRNRKPGKKKRSEE